MQALIAKGASPIHPLFQTQSVSFTVGNDGLWVERQCPFLAVLHNKGHPRRLEALRLLLRVAYNASAAARAALFTNGDKPIGPLCNTGCEWLFDLFRTILEDSDDQVLQVFLEYFATPKLLNYCFTHITRGDGIMKWYPIHQVVKNNSVTCTKLLISTGVDIDPIYVERGVSGFTVQTPLHIACLQGNVQIVSLLLQAGSGIEAVRRRNDAGISPFGKVMSHLLAVEVNETPLHIAVRTGNLELARLLIAHKADPTTHRLVGLKQETLVDLAVTGKILTPTMLLAPGDPYEKLLALLKAPK
eukprot:TRINITY_DN5739_c0_g1_i1.p1 TRINITY_DN5739_c0_g1~~TRINITY_DN5739_c0_g1_i1.p1  ORF type:complete len:353 (-),score=97.80 TRINITY_DN5739_c0_g1_i1:68-970(-)